MNDLVFKVQSLIFSVRIEFFAQTMELNEKKTSFGSGQVLWKTANFAQLFKKFKETKPNMNNWQKLKIYKIYSKKKIQKNEKCK